MSAVEILFLALGLCIGIAVGAALLDVVRARPAPREVHLTITRNALPVRSAAIVTSSDLVAQVEPERAAGAAAASAALASAAALDDTRVPLEVAGGIDPAYAAIQQAAVPTFVGVAAAGGEGRGMTATGDEARLSGGASAGASGVSDAPVAVPGTSDAPGVSTDLCAGQRRLMDERCAVAASAREQAEAAASALRLTRRAYDDAMRRIDEAHGRADPRVVTEAKEVARRAFRSAREQAAARADLELAATIWLTEINRINLEVRNATMLISREQADAAALLASIERQALDADAGRITAEAAGEACRDAQAALAACEGGDLTAAAAAPTASLPAPSDAVWDRGDGRQPEILHLLRGDRGVRERLIAQLAGADLDEQRRYQLWLSELVDAIFATSIETAVLDFPDEHPFWSGFDRAQSRDIVVALASLGYRYDGFGGFANDRLPGQRELSLAVGYAGLDPMRIRQWPSTSEMPELFRDVTVAADEFLATRARDLELSEMVDALGRRSEGLSELWNRWGRVRPALLTVAE